MKLRMLYTIAQPVLRFLFRILFFMRCTGRENVPETGGLVVCGNHKSNLDPPLIGGFLPRKMRYLAKKELFDSKFGNWFLGGLGAVPVERNASDIGLFKLFIKLLKEENAVCVFPEGTRHCDNIEQVKSGAVLFAIKSHSPILPVAVVGDYKLFRPMKVVYGEPIYYTEYYDKKVSQETLHELSVALMRQIYAMAGEDK